MPTVSSQLPEGRHGQDQRTAQQRRHPKHATVRPCHPGRIHHFRVTIVDAGNRIHVPGDGIGGFDQGGVHHVPVTRGTHAQGCLHKRVRDPADGTLIVTPNIKGPVNDFTLDRRRRTHGLKIRILFLIIIGTTFFITAVL